MNKKLHKQLADNILANGTHMLRPEQCLYQCHINNGDAQQQTGTCLLTFHPTSRTGENRMSEGVGHMACQKCRSACPRHASLEPCRAHANDNCAHLVSS